MIVDRGLSLAFHLEPLGQWLEDSEVTELAVNRPGELWCERASVWERHDVGAFDLPHAQAFARALAKFCGSGISDTRPILSASLESGERVQVVRPPACEASTVSITIKKPSTQRLTADDFDAGGFFDHVEPAGRAAARHDAELRSLLEAGKYRALLTRAVELDCVIVVAGETGSGKTTYMKALTDVIPSGQRIITIEDVPELGLPHHPNRVHLFYPSEARDDSPITAASLLKACMRMKPTRIILAECRGAETFDFINSVSSGHGGSMTSCHAGSCDGALKRMARMILQNRQGRALPYDVILQTLNEVIDVVVHVHNDPERGRHITEVWLQP